MINFLVIKRRKYILVYGVLQKSHIDFSPPFVYLSTNGETKRGTKTRKIGTKTRKMLKGPKMRYNSLRNSKVN